MKEIKCPHCGELFAIDETNYNSIVKQVRDHVFEEELKKREAEYNEKLELQKELLAKEVVSKASVKISEQETEIEKLKIKLVFIFFLY